MKAKYYISKDKKKCGIIRETTPKGKLEEWEVYIVRTSPNKTVGEKCRGLRDINNEALEKYWDEVPAGSFWCHLDNKMLEKF